MANSPDNRAYSYTELTVPSLAVAVAQSKSTKENLLGLLHQILPLLSSVQQHQNTDRILSQILLFTVKFAWKTVKYST